MPPEIRFSSAFVVGTAVLVLAVIFALVLVIINLQKKKQ